MDYNKRWRLLRELGSGGQGKVSQVIDLHKFGEEINSYTQFCSLIDKKIRQILGVMESPIKRFEAFIDLVQQVLELENYENHGALKVLHEPEKARDPERASFRIKNEIEAMAKLSHPNLLKIIDCDSEHKWFVSKYYNKGSLSKNRHNFTGNFVAALKAFRPLVDGVADLHEQGYVHRDIKPKNIFLDNDGSLILGDFGLLYYEDEEKTRISETYENVGSRDWMPGWAQGVRIEDIKPSFDVFSLGKLLWAMVSNKPILRLWYYDEQEWNLEKLFPNSPKIEFANKLFKKCIVEKEEDCLPNANDLLVEVDNILAIIENDGSLIGIDVKRKCKVCGVGIYHLEPCSDKGKINKFGLQPQGQTMFKIFTCTHCGHVQLFFERQGQSPDAWEI